MRQPFTRQDLELPLLLLLLTAIPILASVYRLVVLAITPEAGVARFDLLDQRYFSDAAAVTLHVLPGLVFLALGIVQFMPAVRRRSPRLHRWMGRVALLGGLVSAMALYRLAFSLPAMGGLSTILGTYVFATLMILTLVAAFRAIRQRDIARHRAFMIRAFAIGSAVATIRVLGILGEIFLGLSFESSFGLWLWIGMTLHAAIAELILWQTMPKTGRCNVSAAV